LVPHLNMGQCGKICGEQVVIPQRQQTYRTSVVDPGLSKIAHLGGLEGVGCNKNT
jgi:hypothetical protein